MSGKWIDKKTFISTYSPKGMAVEVSFGKQDEKVTDQLDASENSNKKRADKEYNKRGTSDNRLLLMHAICSESPNKWQILETKANFINGIGPVFFNEALKDNTGFPISVVNENTKGWLKKHKLKLLSMESAWQLAFSDEMNWRVTLDSITKKIKTVRLIDNNDIRAVVMRPGETRVMNYYLSTDFGYKSKVVTDTLPMLPAFDPSEPTKFGDFVLHYHLPKPGQKFYGFASWWGTGKWSAVTNKVPDYYEALFKNGFFVTHQIIVPEDYFFVEKQTDEEELAAKEKWIKQVTDTLSSVEEANKIVVTFKKMNLDGKDYMNGIEIKPVENPMNDSAFVKMLEAGNLIQTSGHGLPGILTAVQLGAEQGTSGKEVMAVSNYVQDFLMLIYRNSLAQMFSVLKDIDNLEPGLDIGIGRIPSYTFDSTPKSDASSPLNNKNNV